MKIHYLLLLAIIFASTNTTAFAAKTGDTAPNLFGRTLDDNLFRLKSVPGAKVLNFFWVECVPCSKELPELRLLEKKYPKVMFFAVHVSDNDEEKADVKKFLGKLKGFPKNVVLSSPMVRETFGFKYLPYTVVIGADGKIKAAFAKYEGKKSIAKLERAVKKL